MSALTCCRHFRSPEPLTLMAIGPFAGERQNDCALRTETVLMRQPATSRSIGETHCRAATGDRVMALEGFMAVIPSFSTQQAFMAPFRRMATCNQTFHARAPEKPLPRARSQSTMAHMPFSLLELAPLPATPFPASLAFQAVPQSPMDSHCNLHELNFMGKAVFKIPLSPTIFIPKLFLRLVWHF